MVLVREAESDTGALATLWIIGRIVKTQECKRLFGFCKRSLSERHHRRTHEQGYTQTDMEEFDRIVLERKNYVATREERRYCRDHSTVVLPNR